MHSSVSTLASLGCIGQTLMTKEELNTRVQWQSYVSLEIIKPKGKLFYKGNTLCKVQEMRNDRELAPNHTTRLEKSAHVDLCDFSSISLFLHYMQLKVKCTEIPSQSFWFNQAAWLCKGSYYFYLPTGELAPVRSVSVYMRRKCTETLFQHWPQQLRGQHLLQGHSQPRKGGCEEHRHSSCTIKTLFPLFTLIRTTHAPKEPESLLLSQVHSKTRSHVDCCIPLGDAVMAVDKSSFWRTLGSIFSSLHLTKTKWILWVFFFFFPIFIFGWEKTTRKTDIKVSVDAPSACTYVQACTLGQHWLSAQSVCHPSEPMHCSL